MADNHQRAVATLTIKDAGEMSDAGRADIAGWLRSQADWIEEQGKDYANRFRARKLVVQRFDG